ncbi:hypothetical protein COOONC_01870 [Cooperia oncophora]
MDDRATIHAREARTLRDATVLAIAEVRSDSVAETTRLTHMINEVVHMRHGSHYPDSPVGNLAQCAYESGNCVLKDGSILLWTPNKEEACRFTPVMKMAVGWERSISDSKEFALSWRDSSDRIQDCGAQLILSDQGYAIAPVTRLPRSASADAGIITSNQLSAQLLALEGSVASGVSALFHHSLSALCDRTNLLAFALHTSLATSPTLTVRNLLAREDISATFLGNDLVQLHRCMMIPSRHFQLLPFNGNESRLSVPVNDNSVAFDPTRRDASVVENSTTSLAIKDESTMDTSEPTSQDSSSVSHTPAEKATRLLWQQMTPLRRPFLHLRYDLDRGRSLSSSANEDAPCSSASLRRFRSDQHLAPKERDPMATMTASMEQLCVDTAKQPAQASGRASPTGPPVKGSGWIEAKVSEDLQHRLFGACCGQRGRG